MTTGNPLLGRGSAVFLLLGFAFRGSCLILTAGSAGHGWSRRRRVRIFSLRDR